MAETEERLDLPECLYDLAYEILGLGDLLEKYSNKRKGMEKALEVSKKLAEAEHKFWTSVNTIMEIKDYKVLKLNKEKKKLQIIRIYMEDLGHETITG